MVDGAKANEAWASFCEFFRKSLPSSRVFLQLSNPIFTTLISSIENAVDAIGPTAAASMIEPAVQDFRQVSLEFLGDTGAARDIGSLRALRTLQSPVRFSTGGGPPSSTEKLKPIR